MHERTASRSNGYHATNVRDETCLQWAARLDGLGGIIVADALTTT